YRLRYLPEGEHYILRPRYLDHLTHVHRKARLTHLHLIAPRGKVWDGEVPGQVSVDGLRQRSIAVRNQDLCAGHRSAADVVDRPGESGGRALRLQPERRKRNQSNDVCSHSKPRGSSP